MLLAPYGAMATERWVIRDNYGNRLRVIEQESSGNFTVRNAKGIREYIIEPGISGNYLMRDIQGRRVGRVYKRLDGSIELFDKDQNSLGVFAPGKKR